MIVADTNLVAYLLIPGPFTEAAQQALARDDNWMVPPIWRHEFLNVVATSVRQKRLEESRAKEVLAEAWETVTEEDHHAAWDVVKLSISSRIGTYDCEFIILARQLNVRLVTADKALLQAFPETAISIEQFASGS